MKSWQPFKGRDVGPCDFCWNHEKTSHKDSGEPDLVFALPRFIPSHHHLTAFSQLSNWRSDTLVASEDCGENQ